jgi:hypothetical protein
MTTPVTPKKPQGNYPKCPSRERFPVITGFVTPGSDFPPPHPLDASVTMEVYDATEFIAEGQLERIRVAEVDDAFLIEVNWCVCGAFAASLCGRWEITFFLDDVDGGGERSNGELPNSSRTVAVNSVEPVAGTNDDVTKRCYNLQVTIPGNTVQPGAYSLLAIIKLYGEDRPDKRGKVLGDYLGFAEIPVLVFVRGE